MQSVSERFRSIDTVFMEELGKKTVDRIMIDIHNASLSLKQVADRNGVRCADVVQVCRFHKIDVNCNPTD